MLAGTRHVGAASQSLVAIGRNGAPPASAAGLGPVGLITTLPQAVADNAGHGAVVFARDKTVYLSTCRSGRCATVRVGTSRVLPDAAVAMQPGSGRTTVLWRGRAASGANRLQWRITTGGRLGPVHTLGELGDDPRLGTDATGKTVAIWVRHAIHASDPRGLRTAARRVGEFTRPTTVQPGGVASPHIVTGRGGETIAAWLGASDPQNPSAQAFVATRTPSRAFSSAAPVGGPDTGALALGRAPNGRAVLALDRQIDATTTVVEAAQRAPHGSFGPPQPIAAPQFVPTSLGAVAAVDDLGAATVAWSSPDPAPTVRGTFAARADAGGLFAAPQQLAADLPAAAFGQHPVLAAAGARTVVAWVTAAGAMVATAQG
jgi:hypothetical protein